MRAQLLTCFCVIAAVATCAVESQAGGPAGPSRAEIWRCPYTQDGACVPERSSYGYTPTRWRRWPGAESSMIAPGPEAIPAPKPGKPTPAKPKKDRQELPPGDDDDAPKPPGAEGANPNNPEPPPAQPGADAPQTPSGSEVEQPSSLEDVLRGLPGLEKPPSDDAAPEKKTEAEKKPEAEQPADPFQDDPTDEPTGAPKSAPEKSGARLSPAIQAREMHWRTSNALARKQREAEMASAASVEEPRLLPKPKADRPVLHQSPQSSGRNPLRAGGAPQAEEIRVVPTAHWTVEPSRQASRSSGNPLRGE